MPLSRASFPPRPERRGFHGANPVKITLPENTRVHASRYQLYLPTEAELSAELERERRAAERLLRAARTDATEHDDRESPID